MISDGTTFRFERKREVYYKCTGKVQAGQVEEDGANLDVKGANGSGGLVNSEALKFEHCDVVWHVKWRLALLCGVY